MRLYKVYTKTPPLRGGLGGGVDTVVISNLCP
jgi:hypothetical protein